MKITIHKYIEGDVFKVDIRATDYSQVELEKMASFGEPEINLGGSFTGPPAFSLADSYAKIKTGVPFLAAFDVRDYADAEDRATVWKTEVIARLKAAITALRATTDGYTGETVETY